MAQSRHDHDMEQSVQETVRKVAEETGRTGRVMADVGERTVQAHAEMLQSNTDAMQRVMQSHSELASRLTSRSADQFARALGVGGNEAEAVLQQSARNLSAVVRSSATLNQGVQSVATHWFDFMRQQIEHNMDRFDALMRIRSPQEFAAVHSELMRDQLNALIETTRRAADLSSQAANEASRHMTEAVEAARKAA